MLANVEAREHGGAVWWWDRCNLDAQNKQTRKLVEVGTAARKRGARVKEMDRVARRCRQVLGPPQSAPPGTTGVVSTLEVILGDTGRTEKTNKTKKTLLADRLRTRPSRLAAINPFDFVLFCFFRCESHPPVKP